MIFVNLVLFSPALQTLRAVKYHFNSQTKPEAKFFFLTSQADSGLTPQVTLYELIHRSSMAKFIVLGINAAVVWYLVQRLRTERRVSARLPETHD